MKIGLICTDQIKDKISKHFNDIGISIDNTRSKVCFIQHGFDIPKNRIAIVFDNDNFDDFINVVDKMFIKKQTKNIVGRMDNKYCIIPLSHVYYFEGRGNNTFCISQSGEYIVKEKLYELEIKLPRENFYRISRSYIANINEAKEIIPWFGRRFVINFSNNLSIEVSKNYTKDFKRFLGL